MNISEFKTLFKAAKRTASNFDEFCDELELYLEATKKSAATEPSTLTIEVRDQDSQLLKLLEDIKSASGVGHSFNVIVDPDKDGGRSYFMDGDGSFKISDIKITEDAEEEIEEEKEASVKRAYGVEPPDEALEEIARLIRDGYTEGRLDSENGIHTEWSLKIESWNDEE